MFLGQTRQHPGVFVRGPCPAQHGQRRRRVRLDVTESDPDPPLAEVDPQDAARSGVAPTVAAVHGVAEGLASLEAVASKAGVEAVGSPAVSEAFDGSGDVGRRLWLAGVSGDGPAP
jgi:hypothetical protein